MSQDLLIGVSRGLSVTFWFVGTFDELAVLEFRARADQHDQVRGVHGAPAGLGGLNELERFGDAGGARIYEFTA